MTREYWDATRDREFVLPWCVSCGRAFWYPRPVCPVCLGEEIEYRPALGTGEVYAVSVMHRPGPMRPADSEPYPVVLVDLAEGVRVMGNVVGVEPEAVTVGMAVRATWQPLDDGRNLLQWETA